MLGEKYLRLKCFNILHHMIILYSDEIHADLHYLPSLQVAGKQEIPLIVQTFYMDPEFNCAIGMSCSEHGCQDDYLMIKPSPGVFYCMNDGLTVPNPVLFSPNWRVLS